jgi:hypothetical protein
MKFIIFLINYLLKTNNLESATNFFRIAKRAIKGKERPKYLSRKKSVRVDALTSVDNNVII